MAIASYIADIFVLYIYMFLIIELSALSYNTMCGCVHRYAYIPPRDTTLQGISVTELGSHDNYNTLLFHCCPNNITIHSLI